MACKSTSEIRLEAANVSWGKREITCISPVADLADSLNGKYFTISSTTAEFYIWFSTGAGVDPAPAGKTAIPVVISTNDTVAAILPLMVTAIELQEFYAKESSDGLSLTVEPKLIGAVLAASADVDTAFIVETLTTGLGGDLGRTSDGIEVSIESTSFEVKTNQNGETLVDEIKTGTIMTVSMNLLEMSQERWSLLVGEGLGDKLTPAGGTEFVGFGTSRDYSSMLGLSGELVINPISTVGSSRNFTFWKCLPKPASINFSGTDLQIMNIEFSAYIDESKDTKVSLGGFGDNNQDLRI